MTDSNNKPTTINQFTEACYDNAESKGFYNAKTRIEELIHDEFISGRSEREPMERLMAEFQSIWGLSRLALIMTELAEAAEAIRKPGLASDHLDGFALLDEELSDVFIRVADLSGSMGVDLEAAIHAKMAYNAKRAFMHGKLS